MRETDIERQPQRQDEKRIANRTCKKRRTKISRQRIKYDRYTEEKE